MRRDLSEQVRGLVEQFLEASVSRVEECADALGGHRVEASRGADVVDEEAVSLVRRDAAG
jgi:hypothetical protein